MKANVKNGKRKSAPNHHGPPSVFGFRTAACTNSCPALMSGLFAATLLLIVISAVYGNIHDYRNKCETFPSNLVANRLGFKPEGDFFSVPPSVQEVPNVDFATS
jgi:hypothetical protein